MEKEQDHAKDQAAAQLHSIEEMLSAITKAEGTPEEDELRDQLTQDALEVATRTEFNGSREYMILLCTGGPAVRILGELDDSMEPRPLSARLQYQDWGTPWTDYPLTQKEENTLTDYAQYYYFEIK